MTIQVKVILLIRAVSPLSYEEISPLLLRESGYVNRFSGTEAEAPVQRFPWAIASFECSVAKLILPLDMGVDWGAADGIWSFVKGVLVSM